MPYDRFNLRELLKAAFLSPDLKVFCSDNFREVYENFGDDQSRDDRILDLLDFVEKHKGLEHLAGLVKTANPEKYNEFESRLAAVATPGAEQEITDALRKIQEELERNPDYVYLKRRFEAILERISLLSDYKDLHDALHTIQYSLYHNIVTSTKIVMDDKYANSDLTQYLRDYRREINNMNDAAKGKRVPEEVQWIAQLEQAGSDLEDGIGKGNKEQVDSATQTINEVIGIRPTMVNTKLYAAVYAYKESLPEPTGLMNKVLERINAIAPDSDTAKHFQNGIDSLKDINTRLGLLIAEHNSWQDVDNQLHILPDLLEVGIPKFDKRWQSLRVLIAPYYANSEDKSSLRLKKMDEVLGAAIAANDLERVRKAFENYCSEASDRFFYVDKAVLELCEKLSDIRDELK
jgi:transposase